MSPGRKYNHGTLTLSYGELIYGIPPASKGSEPLLDPGKTTEEPTNASGAQVQKKHTFPHSHG